MQFVSINQDDNSQRSAQAAIMREIYPRVTLVLIWLGEATAGSDALFRGRVEFKLGLISIELYALLTAGIGRGCGSFKRSCLQTSY